jgi:hypothetical protein
LLVSDPRTILLLRERLDRFREDTSARMWDVLNSKTKPDGERLRAAACLAAIDAPDDSNKSEWSAVGKVVVDALVPVLQQNPKALTDWIRVFEPIRGYLVDPLVAYSRNTARDETQRSMAINILVEYAADRADVLADVVQDASLTTFPGLFARLRMHESQAVPLLSARLDQELSRGWDDRPLDPSWVQTSQAIVAKVEAVERPIRLVCRRAIGGVLQPGGELAAVRLPSDTVSSL